MHFSELISQRQSCRSYNPARTVSTEDLTACLEAARLAPSACNSQPWRFYAVNDEQLSPEGARDLDLLFVIETYEPAAEGGEDEHLRNINQNVVCHIYTE